MRMKTALEDYIGREEAIECAVWAAEYVRVRALCEPQSPEDRAIMVAGAAGSADDVVAELREYRANAKP